MARYLYAASVQGIQSFVFQTGKLKEIIGASELVEQICTIFFKEVVSKHCRYLEDNEVIATAGNIKYIFDDVEVCKIVYKAFPKEVMEFAPGISLSQAVIKLSDEGVTKKELDEIEYLLKTKRNQNVRSTEIGYLSILRSRRTGLAAFKSLKSSDGELEYYDLASWKKSQVFEGSISKSNASGSKFKDRLSESFLQNKTDLLFPLEFKDIAFDGEQSNSWIAIIHADGNNIGGLLQELSKEIGLRGKNYDITEFRNFSKALNKATEIAAHNAFTEVEAFWRKKNENFQIDGKGSGKIVPFRPIVLGGDDITVVCRADFALLFSEVFMKFFEIETKNEFNKLGFNCLKDGMTACVGIAFIKHNYPFHYGYELAESLCKQAKKESKKNGLIQAPSCLMYHKVQDSFVTDYNSIKLRELRAVSDMVVRFDYGPYYLHGYGDNSKPTIGKLKEKIITLLDKEGNAIKTHLKQWLADLHINNDVAQQKIKRMLQVCNKNKLKVLEVVDGMSLIHERQQTCGVNKIELFTPVYDWLTILSVTNIKEENK